MNKIPAEQGFQLPAEWHHHSGTQLHWPTNRQTWPGERLQRVEKVFLDIIESLYQYEPVHLFVNDEKTKNYVLNFFQLRDINLQSSTIDIDYSTAGIQAITFHFQPTNDVWARDCGPIFVRRSQNGGVQFAITDWEYNAWGGKYPPYNADNKLPKYVADKYGIKHFKPRMVLEGGSIETNGDGVLLTTRSVLLNKNRNPELSKLEIEQRLKNYLGVKKIIWLKRGLTGDDTDGHIDDLSRFLNKNTILTMICDDPGDINYDVLQENLEILQKSTDQNGKPFKIETLPLPQTQIEGTTVDGSSYVPASYANFYIANGVVLIPTYDKCYDEQALDLFKRYFPDRDVHGIPGADLVWGQGSIHCVTQQWYGLKPAISLAQ